MLGRSPEIAAKRDAPIYAASYYARSPMSLAAARVPLNATNLSSTPYRKPPGDRAVEEFVKQQSRFAKQYRKDGASDFQSWGVKEPIPSGSALPRNSEATAAARAITSSSPLLQARVSKSVPETAHNIPHDSPPTSSMTAKLRNVRVYAPEKDTGYLDEHEARLAERRERRRAKKAIIDPPPPLFCSPSSSIASAPQPSPKKAHRSKRSKKRRSREVPPKDTDVENDQDRSSDTTPRKEKKKRVKLAPGLALMQNFLPTNVARSRITLKPAPKIGVFNKGVASARTKVDHQKSRHPSKNNRGRGSKKKSGVQTVFTEALFLNRTRPRKSSPEASQSSTSGSLPQRSHRHSRDRSARPKKSRRKASQKSRSPSADSIEPVRTLKLQPRTVSRFFPRAAAPTPAEYSQEEVIPLDLENQLYDPHTSRPEDGDEGPLSPPWEIDWEDEGLSSPNVDVPHIQNLLDPGRKSTEVPSPLLLNETICLQDTATGLIQEHDFQIPIPLSVGNTDCPANPYTVACNINTLDTLVLNAGSARNRTPISPRITSNTRYDYPIRPHVQGASNVLAVPASNTALQEPAYDSMTPIPSYYYFLPPQSTDQLEGHAFYQPENNMDDSVPDRYVHQQQHTLAPNMEFPHAFFEEEAPWISFDESAPLVPDSAYESAGQDAYNIGPFFSEPPPDCNPRLDDSYFGYSMEPGLYNEDTLSSAVQPGRDRLCVHDAYHVFHPPREWQSPIPRSHAAAVEEDERMSADLDLDLDLDSDLMKGERQQQQRQQQQFFQQGRALLLGVESLVSGGSGQKDVEMELAKSLVGSEHWIRRGRRS